jgi:MOSC domain-containing protein YiiM
VEAGYLSPNYGLAGDAHAGPGDRQVSLVAVEDVEAVCRQHGIMAGPCDFAANIGTVGLNLMGIPVGGKLKVGEAILEVTGHGKRLDEPHTFSFRGVSLLVEKGLFCRVLEGGRVRNGDPVEVVSPTSSDHLPIY